MLDIFLQFRQIKWTNSEYDCMCFVILEYMLFTEFNLGITSKICDSEKKVCLIVKVISISAPPMTVRIKLQYGA